MVINTVRPLLTFTIKTYYHISMKGILIDIKNRPMCLKCNKRYCMISNSKTKSDGSRYFTKHCRGCINKRLPVKPMTPLQEYKKFNKNNNKYTKHKEDTCKKCGFIPIDYCQLDVDHIDGNHDNNEINNLQTLCANCHRLKSKICRDFRRNRKTIS